MAIEDHAAISTVAFVGGCLLLLISLIEPFNSFLLSTLLATLGFVLLIPGILRLFKAIDDRLASREARKKERVGPK